MLSPGVKASPVTLKAFLYVLQLKEKQHWPKASAKIVTVASILMSTAVVCIFEDLKMDYKAVYPYPSHSHLIPVLFPDFPTFIA